MPGETHIDETPQDYPVDAGPGHAEDLDEQMDDEKVEELQKQIDQADDGQPSKKDLGRITEKAKEQAYNFFVVHEDSGKVEILDTVQPGVVSYAYDPDRVTPRDIRYMLEAVFDAAGIDSATDAKFVLQPLEGFKQAVVVLDIKNRSNIEIGTIELWRYNK